MMKKLVASILALMLVLSVAGLAQAEDNLDEHVTVSLWLYADDYGYYSSYSDNPVVQYLNNRFNMTMEFQMPPMGSEQDQFNTMIGTGEFTDFFDVTYSQDSTAVLFEDGIIRDLAPYVDQYMPNFKAFLEAQENADVRKALYDPDGHLFTLPSAIRVPDDYLAWGGLVYRRDIVDTMTGGFVSFPSGNEEPTTVDDLEYMLELMKQYFEAAGFVDYAPLIIPSTGMFVTGELINGFGTAADYYVVNGEVKFGPATQEFYNYLVKMHDWFEKGYIYKDFASRTTDLFYLPNTSLTYGGAAGVWFGLTSQLEDRMSIPEYGLNMFVKPLSSPLDTANGQDGSQSGILGLVFGRANSNQNGWVCSTTCPEKNLIRFLQMADFMYTEEGGMLHEYGLDKAHGSEENALYVQLGVGDGTYYFDENGQFHWHRLMDETSGEETLNSNGVLGNRLPGIQVVSYLNGNKPDYIKNASACWMKYGAGNNFPGEAYTTADESNTLTRNSTAVTDYVNVMVPKFITGTEPLTEEAFQNFVSRLMSLGVEESLTIRQTVYDRYMGM